MEEVTGVAAGETQQGKIIELVEGHELNRGEKQEGPQAAVRDDNAPPGIKQIINKNNGL